MTASNFNEPEFNLRYRRLFETAQDGILIVDFETGKIDEANPFLLDMLGYEASEIVGRQLWQIGAIVDKDLAVHAFNVLREKGYIRYENLPLRHKTGNVIDVEFVSNVYDVGEAKVIQCNIRDITSRKKSERQLAISTLTQEKQNWAILAYAQAAMALSHGRSPAELINDVCNAIVSQAPYVVAWVGMADADIDKTVRVAGVAGPSKSYTDGLVVSWSEDTLSGKGPVGSSIRLGQPVIILDGDIDPRFEPWRARAKSYGIRCIVSVPIKSAEAVIGALAVYSKIPNAFSDSEVHLFENLANEIGYGLKAIKDQENLSVEIEGKEKAQNQLLLALNATIEAMSKTMEWRDPYTAGHQKRVAKISTIIGKKMGLSEDRLQGLYMAGLVHDIGKVAVPSEILTKPTTLSDLERKMVQEHVNSGYQILKDIPFSWPIADVVHQHHERMDGTGYPLGLKGDEILLEARILAVADTIEAMGSHRPYRPAQDLDVTFRELQKMAGKGLDPQVVQVALELFKDPHVVDELLSRRAI
ncbi:PAS domain S-box protein [Polynucleobacter sp. MWH-Spelu-300-X4]|uniref:HD domain-containing phosphohydrolase n=1 Tax=Polynucleobacter sp. MWH-Spelu-300-X4 TaxID=2689109 RepID=UPI001BFEB8D8|nr:HD domain-containing phosphohydrolase [Polynucleobacter sp. MWH-Spelu-300-X4]QWD79126.1 PAS domain S-box protein [Polynucleobacter sp. MWH-Spelu-300-X4]